MGNNPVNYTDPTGHRPKFLHDIGSGGCNLGWSCPTNSPPAPYGTDSPLFDPLELGIDAVQEHRELISASAEKHGVDAEVLAGVVFNENRVRWTPHEVKDGLGVINTLTAQGTSDVSLGVTQMTISTAAYLDTSPAASVSGVAFDKAKFHHLSTLNVAERLDYVNKLQDPATNIDYAARYLAYIQANGVTDPKLLLAAYNHNHWGKSSAYGDRLDGIRYSMQKHGIQLR